MLDIVFHPSDQAFAERLQQALSGARLRLEHPILIVLLNQNTLADAEVRHAVERAQGQQKRIAPILLQAMPGLPAPYVGLPTFSAPAGQYQLKPLLAFLHRVDLGEARLARSRNLLVAMLLAVVVMFVLALWGVGSGQVRFPSNEYATDDALAFGQIQTLTFPTLDPLMPRSTEDALNFPATVQAAPTRNRIYLMETATALPQNQSATQQAISTSAPMTMMALTQGALTPSSTPAP